MTIFGDFVRESRKKLGMTLDDLAEKVGISPSMISRLENGKRGIPTDTTFYKLAEALHIDWKELSIVAQESKEDENKQKGKPRPFTGKHFVEFVDDAAGVARVPVLRDVTSSRDLLSPEQVIGTRILPVEELKHEYFYLEMSDDSMREAGVSEGDHVLIQIEDTPQTDKTYLVILNDQERAMLRKITYSATEKMFVLQAGNFSVPPILIPRFEWREHMRVIGVAIRVEKTL